MSFTGLMVRREDKTIAGGLEALTLDDIGPGDVVIRSSFSSVNYKDALAVTGKGAILKKFPLVAGIDVSGVVESSDDSRIAVGDQVLVTGCGLGEAHDGGLSEVVRVPADWVVKLPQNLSLHEAMIYGTAGFTAALALHRLEVNGLEPGSGPVVVTGASGGVGSLAITLLKKRGYEVVAVSGKPDQYGHLRKIGAAEVMSLDDLNLGTKPLEKGRFAAAIDNLGGEVLSQLVAATKQWGSVASIGLAAGHATSGTVFPYILRGVSVLGISSTNCPGDLRRQLWQRLATDLKPKDLSEIVTDTLPLSDVVGLCERMIDRQTYGRYVIDCRK